MILRVLLAVLAIWGMTWSKDASAIYMVKTCQTVLVGWDGYEAIYEERCRYENWEGGGDFYDPDPGYGGGGGGGGNYVTCTNIRAERPLNCGNENPGNPADSPSSAVTSAAADSWSFSNYWEPAPAGFDLRFSRIYGCIGGGHGSVNECLLEELRVSTSEPGFESCTACVNFARDLMVSMGASEYRTLDAWLIPILVSQDQLQSVSPPAFSALPAWLRDLITASRAQMDCHDWHNSMSANGCAP